MGEIEAGHVKQGKVERRAASQDGPARFTWPSLCLVALSGTSACRCCYLIDTHTSTTMTACSIYGLAELGFCMPHESATCSTHAHVIYLQ